MNSYILNNGSNSVKFTLNNENIIASNKYHLYSIGQIEKKEVFPRILDRYCGTGCVAFGGDNPCIILNLKLKPECTYKISQNNFIACCDNIKIIIKENVFTVSNVSKEMSYIWVVAFGNYEKIVLAKDEKMVLKSSLMLIYDEKLNFENNDDENITVFGPCTFYIQIINNRTNDRNSLWDIFNNMKNSKIREKLRNI